MGLELLVGWITIWSNLISLFSLQISPSSIPLYLFSSPCLGVLFFMYSFCLPFLDATIRNVYFDGRVSEELICSFIRALCCTTTPWRHKHWEESMGPSWEFISAHLDDSYRTVTQSQHQQTTVWHPPFSTVYFRSFSQFVSSALTSSSTHSKVITLHYPPSCSLHTTHTLTFT